MPNFLGISKISGEKRVDVGTTGLVPVDQLARQCVDLREQTTTYRRLLDFESLERRFERREFVVVEVLVVPEVQAIAQIGEHRDAWMICGNFGVTRRTNRTTPLLLAEDRSHLRRFVDGMPTEPSLTLLFAHHVETTLGHSSHEGHHVFFALQPGSQRTEITQRQRRRVFRAILGMAIVGKVVWFGSDVRTLEPAGNRGKDSDLVARTDPMRRIHFLSVAPHLAARQHTHKVRPVPVACALQETGHGVVVEGVAAASRRLTGSGKEPKRCHERIIGGRVARRFRQ